MERGNPPISKQPSVKYDVNYEPLTLSKALIDLFLEHPKGSDLLALYCFYYYTGKWQHTNQPKATTDYVSVGLNWTTARVQARKKELITFGLINDVTVKSDNGKITGHYIKLNFLWKTTPLENHGVENHGTNALKPNTKKVPPSFLDVQEYCTERKNTVDPKTFMDFYASKGWFVGSSKMKDWQACVRTWERREVKDKKSKFKNMPPFKKYDGIKYFLNEEDGEYYTKGGTLFIE